MKYHVNSVQKWNVQNQKHSKLPHTLEVSVMQSDRNSYCAGIALTCHLGIKTIYMKSKHVRNFMRMILFS